MTARRRYASQLPEWAGIDDEGLPDLREQLGMFGEQVLPEISTL